MTLNDIIKALQATGDGESDPAWTDDIQLTRAAGQERPCRSVFSGQGTTRLGTELCMGEEDCTYSATAVRLCDITGALLTPGDDAGNEISLSETLYFDDDPIKVVYCLDYSTSGEVLMATQRLSDDLEEFIVLEDNA